MSPVFVAIVERWLFMIEVQVCMGHCITSDLSCNDEVAALQSDHCMEVSLYSSCVYRIIATAFYGCCKQHL